MFMYIFIVFALRGGSNKRLSVHLEHEVISVTSSCQIPPWNDDLREDCKRFVQTLTIVCVHPLPLFPYVLLFAPVSLVSHHQHPIHCFPCSLITIFFTFPCLPPALHRCIIIALYRNIHSLNCFGSSWMAVQQAYCLTSFASVELNSGLNSRVFIFLAIILIVAKLLI